MAYDSGAGGPPREVRAVLVDAGGVFFLPDPAVIADVLSEWSVAIDPAGYDDRCYYQAAAALDAAIAVGADWRHSGYAAHCAALGLPVDHAEDAARALMVRQGFWTRVPAGVVDGLRAVVDAGVPVAVVSNADGTVERELREAGVCQVGPGSLPAVRAVVDSTVVGVSKPDPRIFRLGAEAVGAAPEDCVHVGDLVHFDVVGAWGAGVWPVHFDPFGLCPHRRAHDHAGSLADLLDVAGR